MKDEQTHYLKYNKRGLCNESKKIKILYFHYINIIFKDQNENSRNYYSNKRMN